MQPSGVMVSMTQETPIGKIEISPNAIASLAARAVMKSYGVVGMAAPNLRQGLAEILSRNHWKRGVHVSIQGNSIIIDLYVVLEYGLRISEVAHNIMENVNFSVEQALGVPVTAVNIHVQGLRVSEQP
ncbi:MAG: Asp23/Gls24 family envelope stress response protein [Chloroflexi bacterium]|nr:Asp23/Gls24 family envelope stress response protein [Chloroflexota bacterium]